MDDFVGPPTPVRLGNVQRTNEFCEMMNDEGLEDIEDESLSLLTGEVHQAQKWQQSELDSKHETLVKLQIQLTEAREAFETVCKEVDAISRQIYLIQDRMGDMRESSSGLEKEIKCLLVDKRSLKESIVNLKWNSMKESAALSKSIEQMAKHRRLVELFLQNSETFREIEDKTRQVMDLKKRLKCELQTSCQIKGSCIQFEATTTDLLNYRDKLKEQISSMQAQLKKENNNLIIMGKEYDALQKRDASSVNRVKLQIMELDGRIESVGKQNEELREKWKLQCEGR